MTRRAALRGVLGVGVTLVALGAPGAVSAHVLVGRYESPLPLLAYLAAAGLAVALSFAFVLLGDLGSDEDRLAAPAAEVGRVVAVPGILRTVLRAAGIVGWGWIAVQALLGSNADADVASLFLWVFGWVVLAVVSALLGPAWVWLDPFATLYDLAARVGGALGLGGWTRDPVPRALVTWPAVAGLAFFVWLELVVTGGSGGRLLAEALLAYTAVTLLAMGLYGRDEWRAAGETFSVWFGLLGRLAPIALDGPPADGRVRLRPFASGLLGALWSPAQVTVVAIAVGGVIYDGLSQTQPWFDAFGLPGIPGSTILLAGFLLLLVGAVLGVAALVGGSDRAVGRAVIGAGLVPIAVGYIVAHYLTYVLLDTQRLVAIGSDPLGLGWNLFGTAGFEPGLDWLPASLVWALQLGAVVGGHMVGAWVGHREARRSTGPNDPLREVPLAALMVTLTVVTLWSLGQAVVARPAENGPGGATPSAPISDVRAYHGRR